jgi:hypothetical protein
LSSPNHITLKLRGSHMQSLKGINSKTVTKFQIPHMKLENKNLNPLLFPSNESTCKIQSEPRLYCPLPQ